MRDTREKNLGEVVLMLWNRETREENIVDINCLNGILLVVIFLANYHNLSSPRGASIMTTSDARTRSKGIVNVAATSMKEDER